MWGTCAERKEQGQHGQQQVAHNSKTLLAMLGSPVPVLGCGDCEGGMEKVNTSHSAGLEPVQSSKGRVSMSSDTWQTRSFYPCLDD